MVDNLTVTGIICEYNPFHNGHKYIQEFSRKKTGCEYVIALMSGSVVQRGDVAIWDKWKRAEIALKNGADLVVELPSVWVLQSAQSFAYGAVSLFNAMGVVDYLAFGTEGANMERLNAIADILCSQPPKFKETLSLRLDEGIGYPKAMQEALNAQNPYIGDLAPNDILASNYIKAIMETNSKIEPVCVLRDTSYHSKTPSGEGSASATAIREMIFEKKDYGQYVPEMCDDCYSLKKAESYVLGFFKTASPEKLKDIKGMEEGLNNRLISCARKAKSIEDFFNICVSKRYTYHRIRRVVMCCLLDIRGDYEMDYIRVLGFNSKGKRLLSEIKKKSALPLVTKTADFTPCENSMFLKDVLSTDIFSLCNTKGGIEKSGMDYVKSPIIIKQT